MRVGGGIVPAICMVIVPPIKGSIIWPGAEINIGFVVI